MHPFPSMMMHRLGGPTLKVVPSGSATAATNGAAYVTTNPVRVSVAGGLAPITFTWTRLSGDDFNINSPTAFETTFSRYIDNGVPASAVYRCTVKSADFQTVSVDFNVSVSANYLPLSAWLSTSSLQASGVYVVGGPLMQAVFTDFVSVGAQGGTGNYTYQWYKSRGNVIETGAIMDRSWQTQFVAGYGPTDGRPSINYTWWARCQVSDGVTTVHTGEVGLDITMFY